MLPASFLISSIISITEEALSPPAYLVLYLSIRPEVGLNVDPAVIPINPEVGGALVVTQ